MAADPVSGETSFELGGETVTLRFDYAALAKLYAIHGPGFIDTINTALDAWNVETIAEIVAAGTGRDKSEIMEASPALVPAVSAIGAALGAAVWGLEGPPKTEKKRGKPKARWSIPFWGR